MRGNDELEQFYPLAACFWAPGLHVFEHRGEHWLLKPPFGELGLIQFKNVNNLVWFVTKWCTNEPWFEKIKLAYTEPKMNWCHPFW